MLPESSSKIIRFVGGGLILVNRGASARSTPQNAGCQDTKPDDPYPQPVLVLESESLQVSSDVVVVEHKQSPAAACILKCAAISDFDGRCALFFGAAINGKAQNIKNALFANLNS